MSLFHPRPAKAEPARVDSLAYNSNQDGQWDWGWNLLLLILWLCLYRELFRYFAVIFTDQFFRTNQLILFVVLGLILLQVRQGSLYLWWRVRPQLVGVPLGLALGCAVGYLLVERFLDMNIIASSLFFLGTYGLLGLWMAQDRWRQGLPAVLLLIGALPFGDHMQTFVGYPMRIATANLVGEGFRALGVRSLGLDTILTFENGIAHVDLPCSGVKSLWTGGLFLIAVTWIERHPLNWRWLLITAFFAILLFVGNFVRVALLIGVGVVGQLVLLAELIHVPLGVLSFGAACGVALWLVRRNKSSDLQAESERESSGHEAGLAADVRPVWLSPALIACVGIMALLYQPRPATGLTVPPPDWYFPPAITTVSEPLTADEIWWLTQDGAESADRRRFQWGDYTGSMLLITSSTWRAHHRPERCFEVKGLSVDDLRTHLVNPNLPIRVVSLGNGIEQNTHNAVYWFQSADQITEDYGTRMWSDVTFQRQRWVLVSLLFDDIVAPDSPELTPFYAAMAAAVAKGLE